MGETPSVQGCRDLGDQGGRGPAGYDRAALGTGWGAGHLGLLLLEVRKGDFSQRKVSLSWKLITNI